MILLTSFLCYVVIRLSSEDLRDTDLSTLCQGKSLSDFGMAILWAYSNIWDGWEDKMKDGE